MSYIAAPTLEQSITLLFEFYETIIHALLYVHNLYPHQTFTKRKRYGVETHKSLYVPLCEYIDETLAMARLHLEKNTLSALVFQTDKQRIIFKHTAIVPRQPDIARTEREMRNLIIKLSTQQTAVEAESQHSTQTSNAEIHWDLQLIMLDHVGNDVGWEEVRHDDMGSSTEIQAIKDVGCGQFSMALYEEKNT